MIFKFFNEKGEDNIRKIVIDNQVLNDISGTWYLNDKRKKWAASLSSEQGGFWENQDELLWRPEEISMANDRQEFENLSEDIKFAIENILSFLQFLDSVVPENDVSLKFITGDFEIKQALGMHEFIEGGIHTKSYQYILKTLYGENDVKIRDVYYRFKTFKPLAERNKELVKDFEELRKLLYNGIVNSDVNRYKYLFFRSLVRDYFIESSIFFTGFLFFHALNINMNVLSGVNQQISLIRRDEELHIVLFKKIIETCKEEPDMFYDDDIIYEIAYSTGEADKKFYNETLQDRIPGFSKSNIENYIEYTINKRLRALNLNPIYSSNENPFSTIESLNSSSTFRKASFFETGSVDYFSTNDIDWRKSILKKLNSE